MSQLFDDFKKILEYVNLVYLPSSNVHKKEVYDFYYNLDRYINRNRNKIIQKKDINTIIEYFIKKIMQFLFYFNLVILKSESSSSIRHYFPPSINYENTLNLSGDNFYNLLERLFQYEIIGIKILKPKSSTDKVVYFTISDYESLIKILLFWDNSGKFINKVVEDHQIKKEKLLLNEYWEFKLPYEKIIELREIFKKFEVYIYFSEKYINEIFGEKGVIKRNDLTLSDFINSLTLIKKPTRQAIYKWKNKKYIPLAFLIELLNSNYDFDRNIIDKINSIQIGKSSNRIGAKLVKKIINRYDDWFINFFPPPPSSKLGYIFDYVFLTKKKKKTFLDEFNKFLQNFSEIELEKNKEIIETIEGILYKSKSYVILKSIHIRNFKSIDDVFVKFDSGINIFYGLNASGKTSILEAILFAFFFWDFETVLQIKDIYNFKFNFENVSLIRDGQKACKVELQIMSNNHTHKILRELRKDGSHKLIIDDQDIIKKIGNSINLKKIIETEKKRWKEYPESDLVKLFTDEDITVHMEYGFLPGIQWDEPNIGFDRINPRFSYENHQSLYYEGNKILNKAFNYVISEVKNSYKEINCLFEMNEIFSSLFSEYGSINSGAISFYNLVSKKFIVFDFLNKMGENFESNYFIKSCRDFFNKLIVDEINSELLSYSDIFKDDGFSSLIDEKFFEIQIKYSDKKKFYPIDVLSGGEKSKLLLILLGILMDLSSRSNFFLIDEPNELLDPNNIEIMKNYFFQLYRNKQVIICTFIDKYKEFHPALIYEVWKNHNNISHIFRFDDDKETFELNKKLDELEKRIEEKPTDYHYKQKKLVLLINLNLYEEALKYFQSIKEMSLDAFDIERLKTSLKNLVELERVRKESNENKAKFFRARALIYYDLKELHQAVKDIDEAIKIGPKMPENYNFKARNLCHANKSKKALEAIEEGIRLFPKYTGFYSIKSEILEALGRNEEALQDINKAIEIDNDEYWVFYKKAYILNKLERYEEALVVINKAIEFEPHDFVLIQDKLSILKNLNRIDEAINLFNQESEHNVFPPDIYKQFKAQFLRDKAYNLMESGEKDEAIKTIKEAIELLPDWSEYIQPYGEILMHFGEYKAALKQLEKADSLPFRPLETPIQIGICLYELGRYKEALKKLNLGINYAKYSENSTFTTDDEGKTVAVHTPQTELIKKAGKYILEVEKKLKEIEKT